jgi:hypothetical protein
MNHKIRLFLFCPVPENQKPITELILLQENSFLNWVTFSDNKYLNQLVFLSNFPFFNSFFTLFPIAPFSRSFFDFLYFLFSFSLLLFFLTLFSRWSQLENRFKNSRIFYEEGSWYDGQIWEKPLSLIKNEKLIVSQKIQPILERISFTLLFLFLITLFSFLLFFSSL